MRAPRASLVRPPRRLAATPAADAAAHSRAGPAASSRPRRYRRLHSSRHVAGADGPYALIERAHELDVLRAAVPRLAGGDGGVVVVAAPAGLGKTVLLEHAAQRRRREAGCLVRRAAPGPLERHFAFGVVRALLEGAAARRVRASERARLLDGAAAPAGALLLDGAVPGADATMAIAHSVLWLCSALADERAARARGRRRALGRPPVAGGARLPGAAGRRPAAAASSSARAPTIPTRPRTCSA